MARWVVRHAVLVGVLVVGAWAFAEAPVPAQWGVVERYAALLAEGDHYGLRSLFAPGAVFAEQELFWSVEVGPEFVEAVANPVRAMIAGGVHLEVELVAVEGGGAVLVTRERMWSEAVPEALAPLRATAVYVVVGAQIVSITRVLDAEQRDALMREAVIGIWGPVDSLRLEADGTYRLAHSLAGLDDHAWDHGTYDIEGGAITFVSSADSYACKPGDVGTWWLRFEGTDRMKLGQIEERCARRSYGAPGAGPSLVRAAP
jgi:limonene-1,2-epoxide hydrolase